MEKTTWGCLGVNVSLYDGYANPIPLRSIFLPDFLTLTNRRLDMTLRLVREARSKEVARRFKKNLPAITVSGEFSKRSTSGLIRHTGLICLDFDGISNVAYTRHELSLLPYVAFAGESASGKGVFAIIPILRPDFHREHFEALEEEMLRMGLEVDRQCSDICRLRGFSHDNRAYINPNAEVWTKIKKVPVIQHRGRVSTGSDEHRLFKLLDLIEGTRTDITEDRKDWVKIGMALASTFGETGRDYFHRISHFHPRYKPYQTDREYNSYLRLGYKRVSISSVFYIAKKYGLILNS